MTMRFTFDRRPHDDGENDDRRDREFAHNHAVYDDHYARVMARPVEPDDHLRTALLTLARIAAHRDAAAGTRDAAAAWSAREARHTMKYKDAFVAEYEREHAKKTKETPCP